VGSESGGARLNLAARLRSVLSLGGWREPPPPHVRFGPPFMPGLTALGGLDPGTVSKVLERAAAARAARSATAGSRARHVWLALPGDLAAFGIAAAIAPTSALRRGWWEVGLQVLAEWTGREVGAGRHQASVPALAALVPELIGAYFLFLPELRADRAVRAALLRALYARAGRLAQQVASHPADPWRIAAGRALFMAGRFFDGLEARSWVDQGTSLLWSGLREQVNEDGGHGSRSPAWHAFVLRQYLEVFALLTASNDDVPVWSRKRVKGMADFLARVVHPDGTLARFHGGAPDDTPPAAELLAVAGVLLNEAGLALPGPLPGVWPLLVLGEAGRRLHAHLPRRGRWYPARALRRTGFFVLGGAPGDVMLHDGATPPRDRGTGPLGYELSVGGEQLVRQPADGIVIGAVEPGEVDRLGFEPAVVTHVDWRVRDGLAYFAGLRSGGLPGDLRHCRRVFALPGRFWVVCDELSGTGAWNLETRFLVHGEAVLRAACAGRPVLHVARSPSAAVQVVFAGGHAVRVTREADGEAASIALVTAGRLPLALGYALLPRYDGPASLGLEQDAFSLRVTLRLACERYVLTAVQDEVELAVEAA
jgi:hypothetical protein